LIYNDGAIPHSGNAIFEGINSISTQYHLLTTPYILFQGGVDKMIDPFAPLDLEETSPGKDKTTLYCEGMWHALHA
jgi:acylglycerol lipase